MTKTIKFYRTKEQYGAFSNFSRHAVYIDGLIWPTTEHYFQAMKRATVDLQEEIRTAKTPSKAAELGRSRAHPIIDDWDHYWRDFYMLNALRTKFRQHPDLKVLLLSTRDAKLVEHTAKDDYWGDGGDGSGENVLGQMLMQVRGELERR